MSNEIKKRIPIVLTGAFGSGKTEGGVILEEMLTSSFPGAKIRRLADGPHLVDLVTTEAHGNDGALLSASHYHDWNIDKPLQDHEHTDEKSHFPFTVVTPDVSRAMFRRVAADMLQEMVKPPSSLEFVLIELATGTVGDPKISKASFTTGDFIDAVNENDNLRNKLAEMSLAVVTIDASFNTRSRRNGCRPATADGITSSWGVTDEVMQLAADQDFRPWRQVVAEDRIIHINNNPEGKTHLQREMAPVIDLIRQDL